MRAEDLPIPQLPYIKGKGFLPNPIVVNGIPEHADGTRNPKVIGTPEYEMFWNEQIYRCINGYQTGGIFLPGRFYYYMNFNSMLTVNGVITPDYCDLHLQLCYIIEWCKANQKNIIIGKKRRAGVSEFTQKAVVDYGFRFRHVYQAGVAAGQKKYAEDFMTKWSDSETLVVNELKINTLLRNTEEVTSGYVAIENGKEVEKNNGCKIFVRTMHTNPNMFKGLFLNDVVAEECGEFDNLCEFLEATEDCLVDGDTQIGTFFIYGTGGRIEKGSKDFKKIWEDPDDYNCVKFLIAGDRFKKPFYGGATRDGKDISETPNLLKLYKPYQILGCEDREAAIEHIEKRRVILRKGKLDKYLRYCQNNPLNEAEIFTKSGSNNFDVQKLNDQDFQIASNKQKFSKWKLEWVTNVETGLRVEPLKVKAIPAKDTDSEDDCILILDGYHPSGTHQNLYCAGIDGYDQNQAPSSKSKGAMVIIAKQNTFNIPHGVPLATIFARPKYKEMFFEMCIKASVYFGLVRDTLGDKAGSSGIINMYKELQCTKYLAPRPQKFESDNTKQAHEFWVSLNSYSRPMMVGLIEAAIDYNIQNVWFPKVIEQAGNFDVIETDSDNDLIDAWGIALMQAVSNNVTPRDNSMVTKDNPFSLGGWEFDKNGESIPSDEVINHTDNPQKDFDRFGLS